MKNPIRIAIVVTVFLSFAVVLFSQYDGCTTGVASGKVTADGRPLLWKNRDSKYVDNEIAHFRWGEVTFIGLINADDTTQIWAGVNSSGFAIMNAESRDMAVPGVDTGYDDEGYLMKEALIKCKTVDDFESILLETDHSGRNVTSNFGVIDANGCASLFEVGNHEHYRFNANDSGGFLVRANFAFRGYGHDVYGIDRYKRAVDLFNIAINKSILSHPYIISNVSRDINLPVYPFPSEQQGNIYVKIGDTINRYRTVSCVVFHGVKGNENPELTTFWCTLGEPAVSISIPLWVYSEEIPLVLDSSGYSPLNREFQKLKSVIYPIEGEEDLIDLKRLAEIQRAIDSVQHHIFDETDKMLKVWRLDLPAREEVSKFQNEMASLAIKACRNFALE